MDQQSYSNSNQNTPQQNTPPPNKKNNTWIFIGVIALLLGVNIYLFMSNRSKSDKLDTALVERDSVALDRDNIRTEYDAALARLDQLVTKNAQLDSMVANKNSEVAHLKKQIQSILSNSKATSSDLAKAKGLIDLLNRKVKGYEERIAELEGENSRLIDFNDVLVKERDSTVTDNIALQQKVRLGAVLHASNIRMTPIDLRRNGNKEKETGRANRVDVFRITFDIDENRVTDDGVKELFLRIEDPNGKLLSNQAYGSGSTTTSDGQQLNYTLVKQVSLKQGEPVKNVVVDWQQQDDYERGDYKIELYNGGYKIGSGSIHLR